MITDPRYFVTVLDENDKEVAVIDDYLSLIWTKRYSDAGDFILELPMDYFGRDYIKVDYTLILPDDEGFMIIEEMNPVWDPDMGVKLSISGGSGERLLESRVTQGAFLMSGGSFSTISQQMNENIINPVQSFRTIDRWVTSTSTAHTNPTISEYFEIALLYDVVRDICMACGWGFQVALKMGLLPGFPNDRFKRLEVYEGLDRTINQTVNPQIIFSEEFDNVRSTDYQIQTTHEKTVAEVLTNDDDPALQRISVYSGDVTPSGRNRKEFILTA